MDVVRKARTIKTAIVCVIAALLLMLGVSLDIAQSRGTQASKTASFASSRTRRSVRHVWSRHSRRVGHVWSRHGKSRFRRKSRIHSRHSRRFAVRWRPAQTASQLAPQVIQVSQNLSSGGSNGGGNSGRSNSGPDTSQDPPAVRTVVHEPANIVLTGTQNWTNNNIYVLDGDLYIDPGATLNIQQGTIVKLVFDDEIVVNGTLNAQGTARNRVVFTSIHDDIGGDTDGDGASTSPKMGDWNKIQLGIGGTVNMDYATVKYANEGIWYYTSLNPDRRLDLTDYAQRLSVTNSEISNCGDGIYILGLREAVVGNCDIKNNVRMGMMVVNAVSSTVQNNRITGNGTAGQYSLACEISPNALPNFTGNVLSGNLQNAVWVWNRPTTEPNQFSSIGGNATLYSGTTYIIYQGNLLVPGGATLTIQPGVVVKGEPYSTIGGLVVQGTLNAVGSASSPIVFTSWRDSSVGGNTTQITPTPQNSDWIGLKFDGGAGILDYAIIEYTGTGITTLNGGSVTGPNSTAGHVRFGNNAANTAGSNITIQPW